MMDVKWLIDGNPVSQSNLWIHAQETARPGGQCYEVRLSPDRAQKLSQLIGIDLRNDHVFDAETSWNAVEKLYKVLTRPKPSPGTEKGLEGTCLFVINTIESS